MVFKHVCRLFENVITFIFVVLLYCHVHMCACAKALFCAMILINCFSARCVRSQSEIGEKNRDKETEFHCGRVTGKKDDLPQGPD